MAFYRRLADAINDAANAWLPAGYVMGYELAHDSRRMPDDPLLDSDAEDLTLVATGSNESLARWRVRLAVSTKPGAAEDLAALPASGQYLLVEILHVPTGIRAVRTYAYATIRDLITNPNLTAAQKRTQIRNALQNLYDTCAARVAAAGG